MTESTAARVLFVGVLPGPKNGMTLMTEQVLEDLSASLDVDVVDLGRSFEQPGRSWTIRKAVATVQSVGTILRWRGHGSVYIVSNSATALWLTAAQVAAARLARRPLFLHHHTAASMSHAAMRVIDRVAPTDTVHLVSSDSLGERFASNVGGGRTLRIVKPSLMTPPQPRDEQRPADRRFTIGHLSNLTIAKGLDQVIATHRALRASGCDVLCRIAGEPTSPVEANMLASAAEEFGDSLELTGALYGKAKNDFMRSLDAFIFPSRYPNESWAIVLDEAIAAAVPVLTTSFPGSERVIGEGGRVFDVDSFVEQATATCRQWIADPTVHDGARSAAWHLARELHDSSRQELNDLIDHMAREAVPV